MTPTIPQGASTPASGESLTMRAALEEIFRLNVEREWTGDPIDGGCGWVVRSGQYAKIARAALAASSPVRTDADGEEADDSNIVMVACGQCQGIGCGFCDGFGHFNRPVRPGADKAPDATIVGLHTIAALFRGEDVQHGPMLLIPASDIMSLEHDPLPEDAERAERRRRLVERGADTETLRLARGVLSRLPLPGGDVQLQAAIQCAILDGMSWVAPLAALKPEGETGPAVADVTEEMMDAGYAALFNEDGSPKELFANEGFVRSHVRDVVRAALTVSPSPSERDQQQGETLREALKKSLAAIAAAEEALIERQLWTIRFFSKGRTREEIEGAGEWCAPIPELRKTTEIIVAALSTPEAVPVPDKREGEANG